MRPAAWVINAVIAAALAAGCGSKNPPPAVTAEQLQNSFQKAEPAVAQEVHQASSAFQASNYTEAVVIMNRVLQTQQSIDEAQKKAVDALLAQTRLAVQRNPKLDNPQLYQAMSDLLIRVHGEN